ncbi:hypothetical protein CMT41_05665 [Colwellia sp. MT41]|uniref:Uncharacterized protein n=1 Tax=Colwellia marinimaniae TaxID=1513592 RepID=A0ABQ0MV92_9GAMM|nr:MULTISPECIES: hypothetical protein [Colwellia]ALO34273.1 hypothetical protein CMT41_05665 [Colwellia sp. MT41]GAW96286.1 hypothetical protein MTCD1_01900 [Colwellia marinimaniae]
MSIANPLTASSIIQRAAKPKITEEIKKNPLKPDLGVYAKDVVNISKLGLEKQQKATQIEASRTIEDLANKVIRISSTIGRARSVGNLTNSQATSLYNKIAALL